LNGAIPSQKAPKSFVGAGLEIRSVENDLRRCIQGHPPEGHPRSGGNIELEFNFGHKLKNSFIVWSWLADLKTLS
jgi:hypothetical protein